MNNEVLQFFTLCFTKKACHIPDEKKILIDQLITNRVGEVRKFLGKEGRSTVH